MSQTCEECGNQFSKMSTLKNHKAVVHLKSKSYICDKCEKSFTTSSNLKIHRDAVHEKLMKYSCDTCGKQFPVKDRFENHLRIHTGEKPFICEVCSACFSDPSSISNHRKLHLENKSIFKCEVCGNDFTRNSALKVHMLSHITKEGSDGKRRMFPQEVKMAAVQMTNKIGAMKVAVMLGIQLSSIRRWTSLLKNGSNLNCELCGKIFQYNSALLRHFETTHKAEDEDQKSRNRSKSSVFKEEVAKFAITSTFAEAAEKYKVAEITVRRWVNIKKNSINCKSCNINFAYEAELMRHNRNKHDGLVSHENENYPEDVKAKLYALQSLFGLMQAKSKEDSNIENKENIKEADSVMLKYQTLEENLFEEKYLAGVEKEDKSLDTHDANNIEEVYGSKEEGSKDETSSDFKVISSEGEEESFELSEADNGKDEMVLERSENSDEHNTIADDMEKEKAQYVEDISTEEHGSDEMGDENDDELDKIISEIGQETLDDTVDQDTDCASESEIITTMNVENKKGLEIPKIKNDNDKESNKIVYDKKGLKIIFKTTKIKTEAEIEEKKTVNENKRADVKQEDNKTAENVGNDINIGGVSCESRDKLKDAISQMKTEDETINITNVVSKTRIKKRTTEELTCKVCGKVFGVIYYLERHMVKHTGVKNYQCTLCRNTFLHKPSLLRHAKLHTGEKPFVCVLCGNTFSQSGALKRHELTHQPKEIKKGRHKTFKNNVSVVCEKCGKDFQSSIAMKRHMMGFHEKSFDNVCRKCGRGFLSYQKQRFLIHTEKCNPDVIEPTSPPKQCDYCEKSFDRMCSLKRHLQHHTKSKEHFCVNCGQQFADKRNLVLHTQKHHPEHLSQFEVETNEKCDICDEMFKQKTHVLLHKIKEHGAKFPHHCPTCNEGFLKGDLKRKFKTHSKVCSFKFSKVDSVYVLSNSEAI